VFGATLYSQDTKVRHVQHDYRYGPTWMREKVTASGGRVARVLASKSVLFALPLRGRYGV
jgi:hypothetical protein